MDVMPDQSISMDNVKGARNNSGEDFSPGRYLTEQQGGSGRHHTTAKGGRRGKWSNRIERS